MGGTLFYAGELDGAGRISVAAANIAGAASLGATADRAAQKQAVRDGIADFLVNSLDEALRILKNQLRKREAVAVCVGLEPAAVEIEMEERGVRPDLRRADALPEVETQNIVASAEPAIAMWRVTEAPAKWMPRLDAIAVESLGENAWRERRWLRLAPRYLGRLAQGLRLMRCGPVFAEGFVERARMEIKRGAITTEVDVRLQYPDGHVEPHFLMPDYPESASGEIP